MRERDMDLIVLAEDRDKPRSFLYRVINLYVP
jgi:hypothetical protein